MKRPGFALFGTNGAPIGHVDFVALENGRLRVTGWTTAEAVGLYQGGNGSSMRPRISRPDVESELGTDEHVGFDLDAPVSATPAMLRVTVDGQDIHYQIPPTSKGALTLARARLAVAFAGRLTLLSPVLLRWVLTRNPGVKARIFERLSLLSGPSSAMLDDTLFAEPPDLPSPDTPITIIVPIYNALELLPDMLRRVAEHTDLPFRLLIIEDRSSDPEVRPFLRAWVASANCDVELIENDDNLGFIGSVNEAFARAVEIGRHVVILNSDAFVPAGWASRLVGPIVAQDKVATVTPMSNDAEILSVPVICRASELNAGDSDMIDAAASRFDPGASVEIPTGVGFCMAMSIDFLHRLPTFDTAFGRGYGEEVDWCQRAAGIGGRHLALPGLFVEHRGGQSFGAEKMKLIAANNRIVSGRYPDYDGRIQSFINDDPLLTARLALGIAWAASQCAAKEPLEIYLAHSLGGGAEAYLKRRVATTLGTSGAALVLRVGGRLRWQIELHCEGGVVLGVTDSFDLVRKLLDPVARRRIVYSCGVGDADAPELSACLRRLKRDGDALEVLFHDYFPISPSYCLMDKQGHFRGAVTADNSDSAHSFTRADGTSCSLAEWQQGWGALLEAADEVLVFSMTSRDLVLASYPQIAPRLTVRPHDLLAEMPRLDPPAGTTRSAIGVLGGIGYHKGAAILQDLGAALPKGHGPSVVVIGNVDPSYPMPPTVRVHGDYVQDDIPALARRYRIGAWLIPSIWPETFSFTTHEALATGLPVYCFDLGGQAEAAKAAPNGRVVAYDPDGDNVTRLIDRMRADGILGAGDTEIAN